MRSESHERATQGGDPTLLERIRAAPVTASLTAINIVVFLVAESRGSTTEIGTLLRFGASERVHVWMGEYWRLFTPMFLHIGWVHLLWNTYASFGWCAAVERALRGRKFLALYLLSGVGGASFSVLFHRAVSAGASGAAFGVIAATLVLRRRMLPSWNAFVSDPPTRRIAYTTAIWVVLGLTAITMDNFAHLGGFVIGSATAWLLTAPPRAARYAAFSASFCAMLVFTVRPFWRPSPAEARDVAAFANAYLTEKDGFPRDERRAARFADRACAAGSNEGCVGLAYALREGLGVPRDEPRAAALYRTACDKESQAGCVGLAFMLAEGRGIARYEARATALFERACAQGSEDGCVGQGMCLRTHANADDREHGMKIIEDACRKGSRWGCELRDAITRGR
jgi:rhomboid protease GluP